ncbi:MAG TPA: hypothetical protein DCQ08_02365 [Amoebophilaceae bacterium]|nr:hypothetical protein [Amoebophilaceae bacterium]
MAGMALPSYPSNVPPHATWYPGRLFQVHSIEALNYQKLFRAQRTSLLGARLLYSKVAMSTDHVAQQKKRKQ